MSRFRFDPDEQLITVEGRLWGSLGYRKLNLVLDTGSARTLVQPHLLDALGYSPLHAEKRTVIHSPLGDEPGYLIRVARFRALGQSFEGFRTHAHDLADESIDGLLGLDFLRLFDLRFRFEEGSIEAERNSLAAA